MLRRTGVIIVGIMLCVIMLAGETYAQSFTSLEFLNLYKRVAALETAVARMEKTNTAQTVAIKSLSADLTAAQATITGLQVTVATLQTDLATVQGSGVLALSPYLTITRDTRGPLAVFHGLNIQLVNGLGSTATANGLGNLIIGYDAAQDGSWHGATCSDGAYSDEVNCVQAGGTWALSYKSGSHYVVVGDQHNYSQYGGIVAGYGNTSSGRYASVSGGAGNIASGVTASVSGGEVNTASGGSASVSGGAYNTASNTTASVSGGVYNTASAFHASVSGGVVNTASGTWATVSGGHWNQATGSGSTVSGGQSRNATGIWSWAGGNYSSTD